ncbi:MAG: cation:proton antiporter, partial [Kiloniellales bacterium]|nr:cation:proton antiporter [Kiloniellales bacterium]
FLPILLFAGALEVDVRRLQDDFAPILTLAVVAVLACTFFVGYTLSWLFSLPLVACLLLGAVIAATDPSAVVSIFRDLGAPRRLTLLVEGESLFNDAAAIVLFGFFVSVMTDNLMTEPLFAVFQGAWAFLGGLLFGGGAAFLAIECARFLKAHPVAEVTLTLALAYISFVVATAYLDASGAVSTVSAGLVVAARGRTRLSPESWNRLSNVWEQLSFWAVSLIFVLAAMLIPRIFRGLTLEDGLILFVVIIAAVLSRALIVYGLLPVLAYFGKTSAFSSAQKLVLTWGGLRGAVTLALALAVIENPAIPREIADVVAIPATGFLLFTLFVAGPSLRPLLRVLGLDRLSAREEALRERVLRFSGLSVRDQTMKLARDNAMDPRLLEGIVADEGNDGIENADLLESGLRTEIALVTLSNQEEELYYKHLADATVSPALARPGIAVAERLGDAARAQGLAGYRDVLSRELRPSLSLSFALWLHRRFGWEWYLERKLAERFGNLVASQVILRELRRFLRGSVIPLLGAQTGEQLRQLLNERIAARQIWIEGLELQYPAFAEDLRRRYLSRAALRLEELEYRRKWSEALISDELLGKLLDHLNRRRQTITRPMRLELGFKVREMIEKVPLFRGLKPDHVFWLAKRLKPQITLPGEMVVKKGTIGKSMYFVTAGRLEVVLREGAISLGPGDVFGELALLRHGRRTADVRAIDCCHLMSLAKSDFRKLLRLSPELDRHFDKMAEERLRAHRKDDT